MDITGAIIKVESVGDAWRVSLSSLTKEQVAGIMDALGIPVIFVGGNASQPAIDTFQRDSGSDGGRWD